MNGKSDQKGFFRSRLSILGQPPNHLLQLIEQEKNCSPVSVAVVDTAEEHVLAGAHEAYEAGSIKSVLMGETERIKAIFTEN